MKLCATFVLCAFALAANLRAEDNLLAGGDLSKNWETKGNWILDADNVVTLAVPAFTTKNDAGASQEVVSKQIAELQDAATRNTEAVKVLASQLQKAITDIETGAARIEKELHKTRQLCVVAITISSVAILLGITALVAGN